MFEVNKSTVERILHKNKIEIKGQKHFNKKISQEKEDEIISLYKQGLSISKTGEKTGINKSTVTLILKRNQIEIKPGADFNRKVNNEKELEIIQLYDKDYSLKEIAEKLEISVNTISKILKNKGIEIINKYKHLKKLTIDDKKKILELYANGLNFSQIALKVGFVANTVIKVIRNQHSD